MVSPGWRSPTIVSVCQHSPRPTRGDATDRAGRRRRVDPPKGAYADVSDSTRVESLAVS